MKNKLLLLIAISVCTSSKLSAQNFYALDTIQQIEISFSQANWDYILDTAKLGSDSYTMALWVKINGVQFDSAGVKYKGNSSFNPTNAKNPLHIELDHFKTQDYNGLKDIKLSNGYHEPSSVREVLLYRMLQQYMPASNANYAQVTINDTLRGLYTNVEAITKTFLNSRFYSDNNAFVFADNGGCNLVYKGTDTTLYYNPYTLKSDYGWPDLANLCGTLRNNISAIENVLDVDRAIWMMAFTNATVTLDSYIGQSTHNYYIYEDHNDRFNLIIWDLNGGLGVFNKVTTGPGLTTAQMQTMSPMLHSADTLWPLVEKILSVPMYKRMYIAHIKTIVNENFVDSSYYYNALYLQSLIDTAITSDPYGFYTYSEFLTNITTNIIDGPKIIPGLTELMETRTSFLNSTPEFLLVAPVIVSVQASDTLPLLNSSVFITATVTGATNVYLGSRSSIMDKFTRVAMFDDGLNGDGAAGDNIYGVSVAMDESILQYYIYAENANAGIFSPQRAEYEYYIINALKGIVINELMSDNQVTQADPYLEFNDWIEFYNNSASSVNLSGYYLSDDAAMKTKWVFPSGTIVNANSYLIVWADSDTMQTIGLHANFKLSSTGEAVILSNPALQVIDEVSFPILSMDMTYGRYLNGTGAFAILNPTFNGINSLPVSISEIKSGTNFDFSIYPNPATDLLTIEFDAEGSNTFFICNTLGTTVYKGNLNQKIQIDLSFLSKGMYFIKIRNQIRKFVILR